jgi:hypothetical protein
VATSRYRLDGPRGAAAPCQTAPCQTAPGLPDIVR